MNNPRRKILLLTISIVAVIGFAAILWGFPSKNEQKDPQEKEIINTLEETEKRIQQFEKQVEILVGLQGRHLEIYEYFLYVMSMRDQAVLVLAVAYITFARVLKEGGEISKENSQTLEDLEQRYKKATDITIKFLKAEIQKVRKKQSKRKAA